LLEYILFTALTFKTGKDKVRTTTPGLFACKKVSFKSSFQSGQQVKVLASVGHAVKSPVPKYGAAIWVEDVKRIGFTVCVVEYATGSNGTTEVNWIALQSPPPGSQLGTASFNSWSSGTKCKRIVFKQVSSLYLLVSAEDNYRNQRKNWNLIQKLEKKKREKIMCHYCLKRAPIDRIESKQG